MAGADGHGGSHGGEIGHGQSHGGHGPGYHGDTFGDSNHGGHTAHGMLPGGVTGGGGYTAEFVSHDAHGHLHVPHAHEHAGHYGQHSIAQTEAHMLALQIAMQHGCHNFGGFRSGHLHSMPMFHGRAGNTDSHDMQRMINIPGIARDDTTVEVLYWPHRKCDPKNKVREMAKCMGLTRIKPYANNMSERDETKTSILSNTPFGNATDRKNPPNGWYRNVTGKTHLWQEFYQFQPCKLPWPLNSIFGRPRFETWRTFLIVFGATWEFAETGDFETRVAFTVFSLAEGDSFRWDQIRSHRVAAEKLSGALFKYMEAHPATAESIAAREAMEPEWLIPEDNRLVIPRPKVDVVAALTNVPVMPRVQAFTQTEMPERQ